MLWFLVLQGLALIALGAFAIWQGHGLAGAGLIVFGLAWAGGTLVAMRFENKSAALREALASVDPAAAARNAQLKRLRWLELGLVSSAILWVLGTARWIEPGELWSVYVAGALFLAMFAVMLWRLFVTSNLDAEASRALAVSFSDAGARKNPLGKNGNGILTIVVVLLMCAVVAVDQMLSLPFKLGDLIWYAVGIAIVFAIAAGVWRWLGDRRG